MRGRPSKSGTKATNRLREIRSRQGYTVAELSELSGMTADQIYNHEGGRTPIDEVAGRAYSKALNVPVGQIIGEAETLLVQVRGYVGAGAEVFPFDEDSLGTIGEVPAPAGLDPDRTEAFILRGDSMLPIEPGSMIFVGPELRGDPVGKHCLVDTVDGRRFFKFVMKGPSKGRYNLVSSNAPIILDIALRRAARVEDIRRPLRDDYSKALADIIKK